jgi:hypothetical protein
VYLIPICMVGFDRCVVQNPDTVASDGSSDGRKLGFCRMFLPLLVQYLLSWSGGQADIRIRKRWRFVDSDMLSKQYHLKRIY